MRDALAAAGPVGRDLLEVAWDATPVGDPEGWPTSLRNVVRIVLGSRFSMWMAWGPELTFFCNDAYRRDTLGSKYPWALGRSAREVWSEIWPVIGPRIERVLRTGEATWDEGLRLFLERSGYVEETYHTFSYSPLTDDDGAVNGMLCVVAEITEQVVNERRMGTLRDLGIRVSTAETVTAAVTAGCEHLASNAESLPWVAAYLFDDDGTATLCGTAGIAPGHPAAPLVIAPAEPDPAWPVLRMARGEHVTVEGIDARFPDLPTGAWSVPPQTAVLVPLLRPLHERPYGFLVLAANRHRPVDASFMGFADLIAGHFAAAITDARAMEHERERAEALARLDQAKSDFLANVSHELRTPLTLLLGPAEDALADDEHPLGEEQRRRLELIARNGGRMLGLVNTLLDFSRVDAGRDDPVFEPTDLRRYTAELASMFESATERAGLRLTVGGDLDEEVYVDRGQWAKIVLNLLSNAFKFTIAGGVTVTLDREGEDAVLRVADTGAGIPEEEIPRLFERFHRVRGTTSRSIEGSGIGLALVAQLAALHGGRVEATSRLGEGSTFTVFVPLGRAHLPEAKVVNGGDAVAAPAAAAPARSIIQETLSWLESEAGEGETRAEPEPDAEHATVLVVDDNDDMRRYVAELLSGTYRVVTATDGVTALERLAEEPVDLVLTDVMMPRLDGFGLLERMKQEPALAAVPVIMLSARAGEDGMTEGLEAGADDYLVKPFAARELLARVRVNLELERVQAVRDGLQRSQQLLDQAQRLARLGSWELDLTEDRITGSPTLLELLGLRRDELDALGARAVMERVVSPEEATAILETLGELAPGERFVYETTMVDSSGDDLILSVRGELVSQEHAARRVVRGSIQDVTQQRLLQQQLVTAEAERRTVARERAIADELQHSLLPDVESHTAALEMATFYRPGVEGTQVGGDWYDVINLGGGRTAIVIGDVMGRGVRAAAVMGQVKAAVRAFARLDLSPGEIMANLDGIVQDVAPYGIVTCVYGVYDDTDRSLSYANAGHLPPIVVTPEGTSMRLGVDGPPLGSGFVAFDTQQVDLPVGSVLTLYTDGLVEVRHVDLAERIALLESILCEHRHDDLDGVPGMLVDALVESATDDVALAVVRVHDSGSESVRMSLAEDYGAVAEGRTLVRDQLRAWGAPAPLTADLVLITSELVTNALRHARAPFELRLRRVEGEFVVEVSDGASLRPQRRVAAGDDESGRGLTIVEAIADRWGTRSTADGKIVWATRRG